MEPILGRHFHTFSCWLTNTSSHRSLHRATFLEYLVSKSTSHDPGVITRDLYHCQSSGGMRDTHHIFHRLHLQRQATRNTKVLEFFVNLLAYFSYLQSKSVLFSHWIAVFPIPVYVSNRDSVPLKCINHFKNDMQSCISHEKYSEFRIPILRTVLQCDLLCPLINSSAALSCELTQHSSIVYWDEVYVYSFIIFLNFNIYFFLEFVGNLRSSLVVSISRWNET